MTKREPPASCQHEPAYPDHATVVFSLRFPDWVVHLPSERCRTQEPHPIAGCGEFVD